MIPGARLVEGGCVFRVWAPSAAAVEVICEGRRQALSAADGWFSAELSGVVAGDRYRFVLDGGEPLADPASLYQPDGVGGPSQVVDLSDFPWRDQGWRGVSWKDWVLYELHVGTFTSEGTFQAVIPHLPALRELGVTVLELLPVAQNPGAGNWGYDAVFPWAVQHSYGGPRGLQELVDAAHAEGLGVVLDVVPNHLGPEGCVLPRYGPYLIDGRTPWGAAVNLEDPAPRAYWTENMLGWLEHFHVDGLRIDATHALVDDSPRHWLAELSERWDALAERLGRRAYLTVEDLHSKAVTCRPRAQGGHGIHGEWSDDFHHALHAVLTGERIGYYRHFGELERLAEVLRAGWRVPHPPEDERTPEPFEGRAEQLIVYAQNHDQVGNRPQGDRLAAALEPAALRLAAAVTILSPFTPMLFMGEEWGATQPFPFFVDHRGAELQRAVREGRQRGFERFGFSAAAREAALDPNAPATRQAATLDPGAVRSPQQEQLRACTRELLRLRRELPRAASTAELEVSCEGSLLSWRWGEHAVVAHFSAQPSARVLPAGSWQTLFDSADPRWGGPGAGDDRLAPWQVLLLGDR